MKKAVIALAMLLLLGPFMGLLAIGVLMNPAANAECTIDGSGITVGNIPDSLTATTANGETITPQSAATHARGHHHRDRFRHRRVGRDGIQIALMAALTESSLRMLSNTSRVPEAPITQTTATAAIMTRSACSRCARSRGGERSPNSWTPRIKRGRSTAGRTDPTTRSPRGLLDIPGWQQMGKGEAAQSVEVSDLRIGATATSRSRSPSWARSPAPGGLTTISAGAQPVTVASEIAETARVVFPLPRERQVATDPFGPRVTRSPAKTASTPAQDFAAPDTLPSSPPRRGMVTVAEFSSSYGGLSRHRAPHRRAHGRYTAYAYSWRARHPRLGGRSSTRRAAHSRPRAAALVSTGPASAFRGS